jgi:hypothetical protein
MPGRTKRALRVRFGRDVRRVRWHLAGRSVAVSRRAKACPRPTEPQPTPPTTPEAALPTPAPQPAPQPAQPAPVPVQPAPEPVQPTPPAQSEATADPPSEPVTSLSINGEPSLYPSFARGQADYVSRCASGQPLKLEVAAPPGMQVAVDGRAARSGRFAHAVSVGEGQSFTFSVADETTTEHRVRCLPQDFPAWSASRAGQPQSEYHFVGLGSYLIAFGTDGVPAWWQRTAEQNLDGRLLSNGNVAWSRYFGGGFGTDPRMAYEERTLAGTLVRTIQTVGTPLDHHDLQLLPNGNYLVLSYKLREGVDLTAYGMEQDAKVYDAEIQEIAPDGSLEWVWNSQDHIALAEAGRWWNMIGTSGTYDHVHINSVHVTADGNIIFSARHTDAVYKIDRTTGAIIWKLGGTSTPERLTVVGDRDDEQTLGAQHDARELADGTITIHDNRTAMSGRPRAVRYAIDPAARTATLLEEITDPEVPTSGCCGSTRRLTGGNWVTSWGGTPTITEHAPDGTRVFTLDLEGGFTYRDNVVEPGVVGRSQLHSAMDAKHPRGPSRGSTPR